MTFMKEKPVNQLIRYAYCVVRLHSYHCITASFLSTVHYKYSILLQNLCL